MAATSTQVKSVCLSRPKEVHSSEPVAWAYTQKSHITRDALFWDEGGEREEGECERAGVNG